VSIVVVVDHFIISRAQTEYLCSHAMKKLLKNK
jgi:hypothetical protein